MKPLLMLSMDGLAASALSVYGCTWNTTPAIDAIASSGWIADRFVLRSDTDQVCLLDWVGASVSSRLGRRCFITDDESLAQAVAKTGGGWDVRFIPSASGDAGEITHIDENEQTVESFDSTTNMDPESTRLGRLIGEAISCESDPQSSEENASTPDLIWIHSRFLRDVWDAPTEEQAFRLSEDRAVQEIEDASWENMEASDENRDAGEDESEGGVDEPGGNDHGADAEAANGQVNQAPPESPLGASPLCGTLSAPSFQLGDETDPDVVTAWMDAYARQIRLVDYLVEAWLAASTHEDPQFALFSTGGFSLGQNSWFGYRAGPLRSSHWHGVAVVSDVGPIRWPHLIDERWLTHLVQGEMEAIYCPGAWADAASGDDLTLMIEGDRADRAIVTSSWFAVRDSDGTECLFLKPDDRFDQNNVGRLERGVVQELLD